MNSSVIIEELFNIQLTATDTNAHTVLRILMLLYQVVLTVVNLVQEQKL